MDLRVSFANYQRARTIIEKLDALFARVQPVMFEADSPAEVERALAFLTPGQRGLWAVEQLQAEVNNGGFDQYFVNSAGDLAVEALEGLQLIGATKFENVLSRALRM